MEDGRESTTDGRATRSCEANLVEPSAALRSVHEEAHATCAVGAPAERSACQRLLARRTRLVRSPKAESASSTTGRLVEVDILTILDIDAVDPAAGCRPPADVVRLEGTRADGR